MAVKINISASPKAESTPEYIYHWDRIGFAIAVIFAICCGLWFGFSNWSKQHGSASLKPTLNTQVPTTTTTQKPQLTTNQPTPTPKVVVPKTQPKPTLASHLEATAQATQSEPKTTSSEIQISTGTENKPKPTLEVATVSPDTLKAQPQPDALNIKAKAENIEPETLKTAQAKPQEPITDHQQLDFIQKRTQILDESVTRYVVAAGVENREPVGSLKTLTHRKGGVARVYVFSDVQNFKGETIQYHWYQNDNLLAKVDIEVKGNRWRNKTFQNIGPAMTGTWRVELMFGDIPLAKTTFVVKKRQ